MHRGGYLTKTGQDVAGPYGGCHVPHDYTKYRTRYNRRRVGTPVDLEMHHGRANVETAAPLLGEAFDLDPACVDKSLEGGRGRPPVDPVQADLPCRRLEAIRESTFICQRDIEHVDSQRRRPGEHRIDGHIEQSLRKGRGPVASVSPRAHNSPKGRGHRCGARVGAADVSAKATIPRQAR